MGMFEKLFGGSSSTEKKEKKELPWKQLTGMSQLDEIAAASHQKPQVIFKHSTRCGISRAVINRFEATYDLEDTIDLYYLDLLSYRDISNEIAQRFQVWHESPQLLIIKDGKAVHHASHGSISPDMAKYYI